MRGSDPDVGRGAQGRGAPVSHRCARPLVAAACLAATCAFAEGAATPPQNDELATGALVEIGLSDTSGLTPVTQNQQNAVQTATTAPIATLRAGVWLAPRSELSIGISFSYFTTDQNGAHTSVIDVLVAPTYRYHFLPLRPWQLSPFLEVAALITLLDLNSTFNGTPASPLTTTEYGAQAGIGGEYLFGDRFGVVLSGGVRYLNYTLPNNSFGTSGETVNAVQLWGSAAAALHF